MERGRPGETYNIGGHSEVTNLELVRTLCRLLDELTPGQTPYESLITHVTDRAGHDRRYAIDCSKIERELGWAPKESLESGLRKTVQWYLDNAEWMSAVTSGDYRKWVDINYQSRGRLS